jgi:hypothetical protein
MKLNGFAHSFLYHRKSSQSGGRSNRLILIAGRLFVLQKRTEAVTPSE